LLQGFIDDRFAPLIAREHLGVETPGASAGHGQFQPAQPGGQLAAIEAVGLIHALISAFIGLGVEEKLAFVSHQGFQKLAMVFFHLRVEVLEKELAGLLQSPPTGGRLNDERCRGAHGCIVLLGLGLCSSHTTQIHPLFSFYTTTIYTTPFSHVSRIKFGQPPSAVYLNH